MSANNETSRQFAPWQFSLAGLLSFFLACGIYFGLLSAMSPLLARYDHPPSPWRLILTIIVSWGGLWKLYRYWKLDAAMAVHYTGPVACGVLALILLAAGLAFPSAGLAEASFYLLLYGPFISVLFGFPVAVVMLIYRGLNQGS
jgi:hypothetical protein